MKKRLLMGVLVVLLIAGFVWAQKGNLVLNLSFDDCKAGNGKLHNVKCVSGKKGKALSFNGSSSYVSIKNVATDSFTIAFWMKTSATGKGKDAPFYDCTGIIDAENPGGGKDWGIGLCGSKIGFGTAGGTVFSDVSVNTGKWVFVAVTRDKAAGTLKIYINGVLQPMVSPPLDKNVTLNGTPEIYIGAGHVGDKAGRFFKGEIDELKIFNKVLSQSEIQALMK